MHVFQIVLKTIHNSSEHDINISNSIRLTENHYYVNFFICLHGEHQYQIRLWKHHVHKFIIAKLSMISANNATV